MGRTNHAGIGVLAASAGLAAGHLSASVDEPAASPLVAVGTAVIDAAPTPLKELAVATLGTADKPVLIGSVLAVTLAVAGLIGILARRRLWVAGALLSALVMVGGLAALARPTATARDAVPALAALVVGVGVLVGLTELSRRTVPAGTRPGSAAVRGVSRRAVVGASVGVAVGSVLAGVGGQVRATARAARDLVLPRPVEPAAPLPTGLEASVRGISPLQTPTDRFYRVDVNLTVPRIDHDSWSLDIDGMVERPLRLTYDDLTRMRLVERDITLTCVSNEVGGGYVSSGRWLGVLVSDLLDAAGVSGPADQVLSTAVDGFTISTPLHALTDGRDALVAIGLNGAPLPDEHGFPARLVTPGLYGFVGATKWLRRLTVTTYAAEQAYWTRRQWATEAPVKTSARIDTPAPLSTVPSGRVVIGGVAWAQHRGVAAVEVRIDDGPWQPARLGPDIGVDCWRQWYLPWDAKPGLHRLAVRATDRTGGVQTADRAAPFPEGSSGIQEVVVTVS